MTKVLIHPFAGVLSAYGMGLADIQALRERAIETTLEPSVTALDATLDELSAEAMGELTRQGIAEEQVEVLRRAHLRYESTDTPHLVDVGTPAEMQRRFEDARRQRYGFIMPRRRSSLRLRPSKPSA